MLEQYLLFRGLRADTTRGQLTRARDDDASPEINESCELLQRLPRLVAHQSDAKIDFSTWLSKLWQIASHLRTQGIWHTLGKIPEIRVEHMLT